MWKCHFLSHLSIFCLCDLLNWFQPSTICSLSLLLLCLILCFPPKASSIEVHLCYIILIHSFLSFQVEIFGSFKTGLYLPTR